jgi:hypothetical protein
VVEREPPPERLHFFLGGADLEMQAIRTLLEAHASERFSDNRLAWGAAVSVYADAIRAALARGRTPVLVELADDLPADAFDRRRVIVVDHHGPLAGHDRPTALEQVFRLLGLPAAAWTRELALIAANDRGHIRAMQALGATPDEIATIRRRDRAAQGVTAEDEAEAERAVAARRRAGRLTRIDTASRTSSAIADAMEPGLGGPGYDALLVVMPDSLACFADGETVAWLAAAVPGSWSGGDLPTRGYWGAAIGPGRERDQLVERLTRHLAP